jgi:hypothetical protein
VDEVPTTNELRCAARAATIVAYGAGLAGVAVGTLLMRQDELALALLVWVVTFAVGTCLVAVATLIRAQAGVTARLAKLDADLAGLRHDRLRER